MKKRALTALSDSFLPGISVGIGPEMSRAREGIEGEVSDTLPVRLGERG